jgi:amino acid transporter
VVSSIVGYLLLIALTLAIKDISLVLNAKDASGHEVPAVIAILVSALGARAGSLFSALAAMAMWFCGLSAVTWSSRVIYAFARDEGLPASHLWKRVSKQHLTPAPAIWLCVMVAFLAAVYSGAYSVVTSISVIGLYFSYIIPVCLHWRARSTARQLERGPWHLGRYSAAINGIAVLWVIFISIILSLPDQMRAGKSIAAVTIALGLWYGLRERQRFPGPAWAATREGSEYRLKAEL